MNRFARRRAARHGRSSRGQTLAEFALVIPLVLLIFFGLLDAGRAVFVNNTTAQAAREGARLAAAQAPWRGKTGAACAAPTCPSTTTALKNNVVAAVNSMAVSMGNIPSNRVVLVCETPSGAASTNCATNHDQAGNRARVTVTYTFTPITPIIGQLIGTLTFSAVATSTIIY